MKHRPNLKHIGAAGTPYASSFNNGVIAIRPSESGLRFAQRYDERLQEFIDSGRPLEIYLEEHKIQCIVDQELLYVTYLELKEQIKFLLLATKFNDAQFDPNSIIWHGKGTARSHPLYALEKMRYEHAYLFHPLSLVSKALIMAHQFKRGRMVSSNV
ncbi:hypothetical protein KFU94_61255 [Chloroflexi bacterium TSY]|nr:hypothetical protein [Chloroflexi bacterium TSY]